MTTRDEDEISGALQVAIQTQRDIITHQREQEEMCHEETDQGLLSENVSNKATKSKGRTDVLRINACHLALQHKEKFHVLRNILKGNLVSLEEAYTAVLNIGGSVPLSMSNVGRGQYQSGEGTQSNVGHVGNSRTQTLQYRKRT